jgi:pyruvate ferredoxin oxidoreductase beta subunit
MNQPVKFYQTGTFTVGNRLLAPEQRSVQSSIERSNALNSGHRACQGCGEALGARYAIDAAMRATASRLIAANATGCLEVFSTPYPESSWQLPWIHSLFGNAAAVGTGIAAALKVKALKAGQARSDVRVIAQGGDGGTTDIGFGCLSGMFERNDDVLYICYDNEAYMNTGVQRSSATPPAARTATTMAVGARPGADFGKGKNVPLIAMAHEIPYVATATVADLRDLEAKVEHAMSLHGARYLHILVPCLPARLGLGQPGHHQAGPARPRDRHLPGVRGRAWRGDAGDEDPPPPAGRVVPAAAAALRAPVRAEGPSGHAGAHPGRCRSQHPALRLARRRGRRMNRPALQPGRLLAAARQEFP